jgi:hypothetical protein
MNRRDLLKGMALTATGLLLPDPDPIKRFWALDRTMLRGGRGERVVQEIYDESGWFDFSFQGITPILRQFDILRVNGTRYWVESFDMATATARVRLLEHIR